MRKPPIFHTDRKLVVRTLVWTLLIFSTRPAHAQRFTDGEIERYESRAREVQIIRDKWGIPHIYGKTDAACVFGLMYAECEEDFSRVEKNYLEMLGRQAEAYGESYLSTDIMMRLIYDSTQAVADYEKCPAWMHKLLDAFADGVNYYLYKHPSVTPLALQRWEPWYALMFTDGSVSATSTGGIRPPAIWDFYTKNKELSLSQPKRVTHVSAVEKMVLADRGIPEPDKPVSTDAAPPRKNDPGPLEDDPDHGSNGFAIAPSRSASGNALLYINPHVPYYFRMEVQMVSEEGLNAYGAVTWGQFFVYQGFNEHCGWMHTSSYADVADLYAEKISKKDGGWVYAYEGQSRPVRIKPFTLWYKKDDQWLSHTIKGLYTHHGPVIASGNGSWLSLKEYNRSLNALLEAWLITKARTFDEYKEAMKLRANTTNNTVYADDRGNIAYWHGNFMPRRDSSYNWSLPVDGSIAATEWKGLHELDEIVHVYNPATGWIQNCNSTPYTLSGSGSPRRQDYPYYMAPDGENFRALNAVRLLEDARAMTLDSLIAKGYDTYLTAFDQLMPALFEAYTATGAANNGTGANDPALKEAIDTLKRWDRRSAEHSVATTLAIEWGVRMTQYAPKLMRPEDGSHQVDNLLAEIRNTTPEQRLQELTNVLSELQRRFGSWKMEWGDVCRYQRLTGKIQETYDDRLPSLPVGLVPSAFGALPSVVSRYMDNTKKRYAYSGNSFIAAVEFGKKLHARTIVTGGESSNPASPHFSDQIDAYLHGQFKEVFFYKEDVLKNREKSYRPGEE
ncbi:MAG TPA: penicillin acylase family protein [Puia sp.]|nr:penicillin acylase family protein [Puia sp.]